MFILDLNKIEEGDVLLTSQKGLISKTVRVFTNSNFSHAILYVGYGSYIHSDSLGVHSSNIQRLIFQDPENVTVLRPINSKVAKDVTMFARSQIGKEYSIKEAIRTKRTVKTKLENKQFCSRLVAQAFEYAGEKIVNNSAYCTPEEILKSQAFRKVINVVRVASMDEIKFAKSKDPNHRQAEITNQILSESRRKIGIDIQSLEELSLYVIENPSFSDEIVTVFKKSGYLTMWDFDLKKNPWRYNGVLFMSLPLGKEEKRNLAIFEAASAKSLLETFSLQYMYFQRLSDQTSSYIEMEMMLYFKLILNMENRLEAANYVLHNT